MKRRAFITLLGGAAAWPLAARAQQPAVPVIGVLWGRGEKTGGGFPLPPFRRGLADAGFVVDKNVMIELREADLQVSRLPALAISKIAWVANIPNAFSGGAYCDN